MITNVNQNTNDPSSASDDSDFVICSNEDCPYAIPLNTPVASSSSSRKHSKHSFCANPECRYQFKYEECALELRKDREVDVTKICTNELCPYKTLYEECFVEPEQRICSHKDCPFKKKYGYCGIGFINEAEEHERKCTNKKCRLKMLCRECNEKKKKPITHKMCANDLCPYKTYYQECTNLAGRLVEEGEDSIGMCVNELCPYKILYKQCDVFVSDTEICNIKECPYGKVFEDKDGLDRLKVQERVSSKEFPICDNEWCPYKLLYEELGVQDVTTKSIQLETKSIQCIIGSATDICVNEICPFQTEYVQCTSDSTTDIWSNKTCPYMSQSVECIIDSKTETCPSEICPYSPKYLRRTIETTETVLMDEDLYKTQYVECTLDPTTEICSNEICPYSTRYVECFPDSILATKTTTIKEIASKPKKYKFDTCAQFTQVNFIVDDIITDIIEMVMIEMGTILEAQAEYLQTAPCIEATCEIRQKEKRKECNPFRDICIFAEDFIDEILSEASAQADGSYYDNKKGKSDKFAPPREILPIYYPKVTAEKTFVWPSIQDFTIPLGAEKITEYVTSFDVREYWLCGIYLLETTEEPISHLHYYEVICGLPVGVYPIPQATASIFFTIEVSKVIPKRCPVQVTFQMETNRCVHDASQTVIDERWLLQILNAKIKLYRTVNF